MRFSSCIVLTLLALATIALSSANAQAGFCDDNTDPVYKDDCDRSKIYLASKKLLREFATSPKPTGRLGFKSGIYALSLKCNEEFDDPAYNDPEFMFGTSLFQGNFYLRWLIEFQENEMRMRQICCLEKAAVTTVIKKIGSTSFTSGESYDFYSSGKDTIGIPQNSENRKLLTGVVKTGNNYKFNNLAQCSDGLKGFDALQGQFDTIVAYPLIKKSMALMQDGKVEDGMLILVEAASIAPAAWQVHYRLADANIRLGKGVDALSEANGAIKLAPKAPLALAIRGKAYALLKLKDKAIEDYTKALEARPDSYTLKEELQEILENKTPAYKEAMDKALHLSMNRDWKGAIAQYEAALSASPNEPEATLGLARTKSYAGLKNEALADLNALIAGANNNVEALTERASVLNDLNRSGEALADYDRALALQPDNCGHKSGRARTLSTLVRYEDAIKSYTEIVEHCPDYKSYIVRERAETYLSAGKLDLGLADAEAAIQARPDDVYARLTMGRALLLLSRDQEARAQFNKSIAIEGKPWVHFSVANNYAQTKRQPEALAEYSNAVSGDSKNASYLQSRAQAYWYLSKFSEAAADIDHAIALSPGNCEYLLSRAIIQASWRHYPNANEAFAKHLQCDPKSISGHFMHGLSQLREGNIAGARESFNAVLAIDPNDMDAMEGLADVVFEEGKFQESADIYQRLLTKRRAASSLAGLARAKMALASPEARSLAEEAVQLDPTLGDALTVRAELRLKAGQTEEAKADLKKAIQENPMSRAFEILKGVEP